MLKHLTIRNYALIRDLEFTPDAQLSVITGETGAGKSILLGALGLLMGNRADSKILLDDQKKCITEGIFNIGTYQLESLFEDLELDYLTETIIRREISPSGKSRAFINDTPVNLDVLKKVGSKLMDIHSQHETLDLGEQLFQLKLVDSYAGNELLLKEYKNCWTEFKNSEVKLTKLQQEAEKLKQESDYVRFQFQELEDAKLENEEQERLEHLVKVGENAEWITTKLHEASNLLGEGEYSGNKILSEVKSILNGLSSYHPTYQALLERIESLKVESEDIIKELESESEKIEFNPEKINENQQRLDLIYQLQRKHKVQTISELLNLKSDFSRQIFKVDHLDHDILSAQAEVNKNQEVLSGLAEQLSQARKKCIKGIEQAAEKLIKELGIPDGRVQIEHKRQANGPTGGDLIKFLFSANKGVGLRSLAEVASGGEFSRLMFVMKYIMAEQTSMPTLILDEIDAGISGDVAQRLGQLMKKMAAGHQVIAISHLAPIAAKAHSHFIVYKESSGSIAASQIKLLKPEMRVEELARIISGNKPSNTALKYAKELLD